MPITKEQAEVLHLLSANRSSSAYLAGGLVAARTSSRISDDIDFFHDSPELALATFKQDKVVLEAAGYEVVAPDPRPGFVRATILKGDFSLRVDWAHEAAWHFFEPIQSEETGYELHWADAATNKVLAMASRAEIRDAFDVLFWHRNPLSLGALIWAAAGKDLGLTPGLILEELRRNARITPDDLEMLQVSTPIDPVAFGASFRQAAREAEELIMKLPPETVGHLFLGEGGEVIEPDPDENATLQRPLKPSRGGLVAQIDSRCEL